MGSKPTSDAMQHRRHPWIAVLSLSAQALNRFAIGALVSGVVATKDLLRGFRCRVCAVGRGVLNINELNRFETSYRALEPLAL